MENFEYKEMKSIGWEYRKNTIEGADVLKTVFWDAGTRMPNFYIWFGTRGVSGTINMRCAREGSIDVKMGDYMLMADTFLPRNMETLVQAYGSKVFKITMAQSLDVFKFNKT